MNEQSSSGGVNYKQVGADYFEKRGLKRYAKVWSLWALGVGAVINAADPEVAAARSADPDGFFWLGFDIASGLFGDPAAGSQGQRVFGAEAGAIRESLNAAGQRGFNSSMKLHLGRSYR